MRRGPAPADAARETIVFRRAAFYFEAWHAYLGVGLLLAWVFLGGWLLRRSVRDHVPRRKAAPARCFGVSFLSALAGYVAGIAIYFLVEALAKAAGADGKWYGIPFGAAAFLAGTYVIVYASFTLPARALLRRWLRSFGPPALLLAASAPAWGYSYVQWQRRLDRHHSLYHLRCVFDGITQYYRARRRFPDRLQTLVDDRVIAPEHLHSRRPTGRDVDYFYRAPGPVPPERRGQCLLACDFLTNHEGRGRAVLFADGMTQWFDAGELDELFKLAENRGFADALRQAERERAASPAAP
jgi:hypothetical protein